MTIPKILTLATSSIRRIPRKNAACMPEITIMNTIMDSTPSSLEYISLPKVKLEIGTRNKKKDIEPSTPNITAKRLKIRIILAAAISSLPTSAIFLTPLLFANPIPATVPAKLNVVLKSPNKPTPDGPIIRAITLDTRIRKTMIIADDPPMMVVDFRMRVFTFSSIL